MDPGAAIEVEVVYAERDRQAVVTLRVPPRTTVGEAVAASGLLERFPQADPWRFGIGVYGETVPPERVLRDGDRVEIYRPLEIDPKDARRLRAEKSREKSRR